MTYDSRTVARAGRLETTWPFLIGLVWWIAMYPGLFGEDSLMNLAESTHGPRTVWFTAWWIDVIRLTSLGGRWFALVTLFDVVTLVFATREWIRACFPPGRARAWALCLLCATPLIGGLGIQLRHDIPMTAGLLLWTAVMTRTRWFSARLDAQDYWQLAAAVLLLATRHNGLPTIVLAGALSVFVARPARQRGLLVMAAGGIAIAAWTQVTARVSGQQHSVERLQTIEWAIADISCLLARSDAVVSNRDWDVLERIASRDDWPNTAACTFLDPLYAAPSFNRAAATREYAGVVGVWLALSMENPWAMIQVHSGRTRLFLPPFVAGWPTNDHLPFIHSTILPNEFGLAWAFPRIANAFRSLIRAWNGAKLFLANAGLWLAVLAVFASMHRHDDVVRLLPTVIVGASLDALLLATAPISEGRYGLFILICGQAAALVACIDVVRGWRAPSMPSARSAEPTRA